jgi:hypothetical protein
MGDGPTGTRVISSRSDAQNTARRLTISLDGVFMTVGIHRNVLFGSSAARLLRGV